MKKILAILAVMVFACSAITFFGCDASGSGADSDVVVTENQYVAYVNEIYANRGKYVEKTISIEGMFAKYTDGNYWVYRNGPSCCNTDSWCGFILEGIQANNRPHVNDWIAVKGVFKYNSSTGNPYLRVTSIEIKNDQRGKETVGNSVL